MGGGPAKDHVLILMPRPEPKELVEGIRNKFPDIDVVYHEVSYNKRQPEPLPASIWKDVTILFTFSSLPDNPADAPNLQLIQLSSAGSNHLQKHPIYTDTDITIATSSGIHGPQIAEWVVMTALVQSHHYNQLHDLQKAHKWGKTGITDDVHKVRDMVGRRLGVLGYGSIGRQVGRVAKALGMDVVAYTATPKDTAEKKKDSGFIVPGTGDPNGEIPSAWYGGLDPESRRHFLAQDIDWLLVSVPLTKDTLHFLSEPEFKALSQDGKKPGFITNIARGPIIDQPMLIEALKDGTVAGAALDVTDPEPLPEDSELWDLPNVTVTPHISGASEAYFERSFLVLETNLSRRQKGESLVNVVRRERGY
jgi:phosphoglycerate dehydrogenase-like enzyme